MKLSSHITPRQTWHLPHIGRRARWLLALFLFSCSASLASDLPPVGRLLSTPTQRAQLDQLRHDTGKPLPPRPNFPDESIIRPQIRQAPLPVSKEVAQPEAPPPPQHFNGFVVRSDGPATVWVNREPLPLTTDARGQLLIQPGSGKAPLPLQAGQVYLPQQGEVVEAFGSNGKIAVHQASLAVEKDDLDANGKPATKAGRKPPKEVRR